MRRYFFDVDDDGRQVRDVVGKKLIDLAVAVLETGALLRSLEAIRRMQSRPGTSRVSVRDEYGRKVYQGSISFDR